MPMYTNNATTSTSSSTEIVAAAKFGKMIHLQNEGDDDVYVKFGEDASSSEYDLKLFAGSWLEFKKEDIPKGRTTDGNLCSVNVRAVSGTPRVNAVSFY